ncbi:MAG TPA: adenylate/guanylate cyclase domain-containing protein, partial [Spirochaetia bacterium]|nr:adenylate/guanylate cyclase domain-containing protein [Spirochaetia bacterium]
DEEKRLVRVERDRVPGVFSDARDVFARLQALRSSLQQALVGSFCIVSLGPGTGAAPAAAPRPETPFGAAATDSRASAALVATLLSGRFLREASAPVTLLAAAALSVLAAVALLRFKPLAGLLVGLGASVVALAGLGALFVLAGFFVPPSVPAASMLVTVIALSSLKAGWKRAASRTVRTAFGGRVSAETMLRIHASRDQLALDGSRRALTVLCLAEDLPVRGPAGDPREIVRRLRTHREAVGEAVAGLGGMLVESGARVTAAFGVPLDGADHARRACVAALRARALEHELNGGVALEFSSRIGIHTGEGVSGFLGPGRLAVYGIVGAATDVAARLESLNESLGTSILVSETAREQAGPGFVVRRVATVAVGRQDSLRAFELLAEQGGPGALPAETILEFETAVSKFESGEIPAAARLFQQVLARVPGDGPSMAYIRRCRRLMESPGRAE